MKPWSGRPCMDLWVRKSQVLAPSALRLSLWPWPNYFTFPSSLFSSYIWINRLCKGNRNHVKTESFLLVFLFQMSTNRLHYYFSIILASLGHLTCFNIINETVTKPRRIFQEFWSRSLHQYYAISLTGLKPRIINTPIHDLWQLLQSYNAIALQLPFLPKFCTSLELLTSILKFLVVFFSEAFH